MTKLIVRWSDSTKKTEGRRASAGPGPQNDPRQACAYKVGMLKIQELRERAQQELGNKFDQREFRDAVLKNGAVPLEILEEQINLYVQKKRHASPSSLR